MNVVLKRNLIRYGVPLLIGGVLVAVYSHGVGASPTSAPAEPWQRAPADLADAPKLCDVIGIVQLIIRYAIAAGGLATFGMFLFGGVQFLMAGSNDAAIQTARGTITWALIGMVILFCSYFILEGISQFTGVTVTDFSYPWVGDVPNPFPCGTE